MRGIGLCAEILKPNENMLIDTFNSPNSLAGYLADGWANGGAFAPVWASSQYGYANGTLDITLEKVGTQYLSGAYLSLETYSYGRLEARLKAADGSGIINGLFTYGANPHDEIDIEILGKDTTKVQFNYFANGIGGHEKLVDLGFDAANGFHVYAIEWSKTSIQWFVDGVKLYSVSTGPVPSTPGKVMANLWNSTVLNNWAGPFDSRELPATMSLDWIRYIPSGEDAPTSLDAERIFDWAESNFHDLLPEHAETQQVSGFNARIYSSGNAIGEKEGNLYSYIPGQEIRLVGSVNEILPQAEIMGF
jgi:endo-1,3-1,4-beta-glycanase ExoK